MKVLENARQVVTPLSNGNFAILDNASIVYQNDRILFVGPAVETHKLYPDAERIDVSGKVLTPGFVDAHTHAVFAGDRSEEFLMRLRGITYQEIAAAGGGIQHTVEATRKATEEELLEKATRDLQTMLAYGTTTVEIKSGYGLDWENERKLLRVANRLKETTPLDIVVTFLGAHDFPREKTREQYMGELIEEMLPEVAQQKLAEFCDVFCDQGYYSREQTEEISRRARGLGLKIKLHVDELADVQGAELAAELKAVSADHLILANETGIQRMAQARVVGVLLPGTSFGLRVKKHAPARTMIQHGVRVALATDFNPGTCYCHSLQYILQLSVLLYGLTPEEALTAVTLHGAAAIDRQDLVGSLEAGKQMDCLIFRIPHYSYLFYNLGINHLETVIKKGKTAWSRN